MAKFEQVLKQYGRFKERKGESKQISLKELRKLKESFSAGKFDKESDSPRKSLREGSKRTSARRPLRERSEKGLRRPLREGSKRTSARRPLRESAKKAKDFTKLVSDYSKFKETITGSKIVDSSEKKVLRDSLKTKRVPSRRTLKETRVKRKPSNQKMSLREAKVNRNLSKLKEAKRLFFKGYRLFKENDMRESADVVTEAVDVMETIDTTEVPNTVVSQIENLAIKINNLASEVGAEPITNLGADVDAGVPPALGTTSETLLENKRKKLSGSRSMKKMKEAKLLCKRGVRKLKENDIEGATEALNQAEDLIGEVEDVSALVPEAIKAEVENIKADLDSLATDIGVEDTELDTQPMLERKSKRRLQGRKLHENASDFINNKLPFAKGKKHPKFRTDLPSRKTEDSKSFVENLENKPEIKVNERYDFKKLFREGSL